MTHAKPIFNLQLTYEDALEAAKDFQKTHKDDDGKDFHLWEDPRNFYGDRITFRTDFFYKESTLIEDIGEEFEVGIIEIEARAALFWLIDRHRGFNPLELGEIIVGRQGFEDKEIAIFTYLSRYDDCLRDFITEKAFRLINK